MTPAKIRKARRRVGFVLVVTQIEYLAAAVVKNRKLDPDIQRNDEEVLVALEVLAPLAAELNAEPAILDSTPPGRRNAYFPINSWRIVRLWVGDESYQVDVEEVR